MFSKNVRILYLYLVCLITLFMVIGGIISGIYNIAELKFPTSYFNYDYKYEAIDEDYLTEEEYNQRVAELEKEKQEDIIRQRNYTLRDIVSSLAFVIVPLPIYLYSWSRIEKERKENNEKDGE